MDINLQDRSDEFKSFYNAFAFESYGVSMGRVAEHAAFNFRKLSIEEKQIGIQWFLNLFDMQKDYYAIPYLQVVEYSKDIRFLPYLNNYYKKLKIDNKATAFVSVESGMVSVPAAKVPVKNRFRTELAFLKRVIKAIKDSDKARNTIKFIIKSVDVGPDDLQPQLPVKVNALKQLPGVDSDNYWLVELDKSISYNSMAITHFIIGTVFEAESIIKSTKKNIGLNIAYVVDESITNDGFLDFEKANFVGRCIADRIS